MQKRTYLENLESKAQGVVASLQNVTSGAVVNDDFSSVVDYCTEVLKGDPALDCVIITKNDGFSVIIERTQWRFETKAGAVWRPQQRAVTSGIGQMPLFQRRVFFYHQPFDYSGIQWGWIHVGLSLQNYDRSVAAMYQRTGILAIFCIALSLLASVVYAKHLVHPILRLQQVVQQVAGGDLTVRAAVHRGDELGVLATSINAMTDALQRRGLFLESMRFTAQKFLSTANWELVVTEVLAKLGEAAALSRIFILEKQLHPDGKASLKQVCAWESASCPKPDQGFDQNVLVLLGTEFDIYVSRLAQGQSLCSQNVEMSARARQLHDARRVKSFIILPIKVENHWWGAVAMVDCVATRAWTNGERDSFQAVADMFGAAIGLQLAQNALVQAKDAAEAASQAKSQFLANMSHEIRTPITGVIGMLQLLQRSDLTRHQARYAGNALASAKTLLTVIGDVLDFSKIEAGKMELEELLFDPAEVLDTVMRLFAERAENQGIELVYHLGEEVPRQLRGDSNRLRQILVNLVGNAVKFTPQGEVLLACERLEAAAESTTLRFEIRDTGCGIAPEKQQLIFDAFSQADNSMTRKYGGTGLGLTISRQLCELMGGRISVQSLPGKGATFAFALRFKNVPEPPAAATRLRDLRNLRVLVVDDCDATREINRAWIAAWHGQAADAPDAVQGLEMLRRAARGGQPFHVAVLDWKMPQLDGLALAHAIKSDELLKTTGLVLLSSYTQRAGFDALQAAGFAASVPKPAGKSDLYDAIITAANGEFSHREGPAATGQLPVLAPEAAGHTILLAEDNEINREVATEMLSALGYRCHWVQNGRQAVEAWSRGHVDLILMDCQMPEMDGYEAARAIRMDEACRSEPRRIPIVALTAHAAKGDRDRCLAAGMDDYLAKPLDPQTMSAVLTKWLPPKAAAPGVPAAESSGPVDYPSLLRRCLNKPELAARLVALLATQAGQDVSAMTKAMQQNDAAALAAAAHRLTGAAANVSAENLRQTARALEQLGRGGNLAAAPALLEQANAELTRLSLYAQTLTPAKTTGQDKPAETS
jgi:signal transduction histidine kinase/CheY-like chemotaxis protein/HAMP domain-containing protein